MPANPFDFSKSGGVINANSKTKFIGNGIDVKFLPKRGNWDVSECLFNGCEFIGTTLNDVCYSSSNAVPYPNKHNPWAGAANAQQRTYAGIICERIKDDAILFVSSSHFENMVYGIKSFNTSFNVENSRFNNVVVGISLDNPTLNINSHIISNSKFTNIFSTEAKAMAIYINAGTDDNIFGNTFGDQYSYDQSKNILGIYINNSTKFSIYYNKFMYFTTGIRVNNSGESGQIGLHSNTWEVNKFYNCKTSILTGANNPSLQIFCNEFTNEPEYSYDKTMKNTGLLVDQGNSGKPTGNLFHSSLKSVNSGSLATQYRYYVNNSFTSNLELVPNTTNEFVEPCLTSVAYSASNCFVSRFSTNPIQNTTWLASLQTTLNNQKQQLAAIVQNLDQGKTLMLLQAINSNTSGGHLKDILLDNSPLSDTVLISVITRSNAMSPGTFKDMITANLPVSNKVLPYLLAKIATFPKGIADQIRKMNYFNPSVTTPASLQAQINETEHERNMILSNLINQLMYNGQKSAALQVLEGETTLESKQLLAATYLIDTNLTAASVKLNAIQPINQDVADWLTLYNMLYQLAVQHQSLYDMSATQLQVVRDLAYQNDDNLARANARGILSLLFNEEFSYDDAGSTARMIKQNIDIPTFIDNGNLIEYLGDNFPNPFKGFTNIPYYLNEGRTGTINIYNAQAVLLQTFVATEGENTLELKTHEFASGLYFYSLVVDGETIEWKKMVLVR